MKSILTLVCSPVVLLLACGGAGESGSGGESLGTTAQEGRSWQGRSWQGRSWQGVSTAVSSVLRAKIGDVAVDGLHLEGTVLVGALAGQPVSGADFAGATITQQDVDGTTFDSVITSVQTDPQDPSGEILLYTLTAYNPNTGATENICNPDPWGGRYATPVYGSWDSSGAHLDSTTQFMFACTSGVVAKCVRWGYKPWKTVAGSALADYHQACTRMARADYCGDGVSHTEDGTLIDLYDDLGIQVRSAPDLQSPLFFDAAWSPKGAYCVAKDRWLKLSSLVSVTLDCKLKFVNLLPLVTASPVDSADVCLVKRSDIARSEVHLDNQSALNIELK